MRDVLGLTKVNFNACIYGDGLSVRLRFAYQVGDVLTAIPPDCVTPPLPFGTNLARLVHDTAVIC